MNQPFLLVNLIGLIRIILRLRNKIILKFLFYQYYLDVKYIQILKIIFWGFSRSGMNSPLRWSISLSFTRRYVPETGHENYQPLGNICRVTSETFFFLWWYIADLNWKTFSKGFRKNTKFQELYLAYNCTCRLSSRTAQTATPRRHYSSKKLEKNIFSILLP